MKGKREAAPLRETLRGLGGLGARNREWRECRGVARHPAARQFSETPELPVAKATRGHGEAWIAHEATKPTHKSARFTSR